MYKCAVQCYTLYMQSDCYLTILLIHQVGDPIPILSDSTKPSCLHRTVPAPAVGGTDWGLGRGEQEWEVEGLRGEGGRERGEVG